MTTVRLSGAVGSGEAPSVRLAGASGAGAQPGVITLSGVVGGFTPAVIPDAGLWFHPDGTEWYPAQLWIYVPD